MPLPLLADPLSLGPLDAGVPYTYVIPAKNADSYHFDALPGWDISLDDNVVTLAWHPRDFDLLGLGGGVAWADSHEFTLHLYASNAFGSVPHDVVLKTRAISAGGLGFDIVQTDPNWYAAMGFGFSVGDRLFLRHSEDEVTLFVITGKRTFAPNLGTPHDEYQVAESGRLAIGSWRVISSQMGRTMGDIPPTSPAHATATRGVNFTYPLTDDGFSGLSRAIGVPEGIGLDQTVPQLQGRPIEWGWFPVILRNGSFQRYLILEVAPGAYDSVITSSGTSTAIVGRPWTYQAKAPSLSGTIDWSVNGAPIEIATPANGLFTGTFDRTGVFTFEVVADNGLDHVLKNLTVTVSPDIPVIDTGFDGVNANTFVYSNSQAIQIPFSATNSPTRWSATTLPRGLELDAETGVLSGYVGVAGLYSFRLTAANETGASVPVLFKLRITVSENVINKAPFLRWLHNDPNIIDLQTQVRSPRTVSSYYMAQSNTLVASLGDDLRLAVLLIDPTQNEPYLAGATSVRIGMRRKDEFDDSYYWFSENFSEQATSGHAWYLFEGKLDGPTLRYWLEELNDSTEPEAASEGLSAMCQIRWINPEGLECRSAVFGFTILQPPLQGTGPLPSPVSGIGYPPPSRLLSPEFPPEITSTSDLTAIATPPDNRRISFKSDGQFFTYQFIAGDTTETNLPLTLQAEDGTGCWFLIMQYDPQGNVDDAGTMIFPGGVVTQGSFILDGPMPFFKGSGLRMRLGGGALGAAATAQGDRLPLVSYCFIEYQLAGSVFQSTPEITTGETEGTRVIPGWECDLWNNSAPGRIVSFTINGNSLVLNPGDRMHLRAVAAPNVFEYTITTPLGRALMASPATVPAAATDPGLPGMVALDANYLYACTAANTWKRVALNSW